VDVVIVVGAQEQFQHPSPCEVCREEGATAYHIEEAAELDAAWVKGVENVGVTAGAFHPGMAHGSGDRAPAADRAGAAA